MRIPCYSRPGSVVFLDDEPTYLEMIAEVLPHAWDLRLFSHPGDCLTAMRHQAASADADAWHHREILEGWRSGQSLVSGILRYWKHDGVHRYSLSRVWVVDYSMPAMNGLQALQAARELGVTRVLLTGRADEHIAIGGFNAGLIDQFIPKQTHDMAARLTTLIDAELRKGPPVIGQMWQQSLTREQLRVLEDPTVAQALVELVRTHGWVEYVLIGQPFGVLALDPDGQAHWVQLELPQGLADLSELARLHGVSAAAIREIEAGQALFDIELRLALSDTAGQVHPAARLGSGPQAPAFSVLPIGEDHSPGYPASLACYRRVQGERVIERVDGRTAQLN